MKKNNIHLIQKGLLMLAAMCLPLLSSAQEADAPATVSYFSNPLFNTLLVIIIILGIMAVSLASALKNIVSSDMYIDKLKKDKEHNAGVSAKSLLWLVLFSCLAGTAFSQEASALSKAADDGRIGGIDQFTFYTMLVAIFLELIAIGVMFSTFKSILAPNLIQQTVAAEAKKTKNIFDKLNDTVELEQEESIMLDHDYDGIKELDNNLPPWWKYGFYLTILVGIVYLVNYHIMGTSPLQKEEYKLSVKKAEAEVAEFMKKSANNVDESTVKMLSAAADLAAGKDAFMASCAACHGRAGEGGVGPNLTDEYWVHGGSVKDIFKTIKYGWPDKGMKSWKDDFSPMQIAQITSFIRTLKGTNPPNQKEKQGDLYTEEAEAPAAPADSTNVTTDSTKALVSELPK